MHVNQGTNQWHEPWNAGRIVAAKLPFKPKHICTRDERSSMKIGLAPR